MTSAVDIAAAIGAPLLTVVVPASSGPGIQDVFLAETPDLPPGHPGDLVVGLGLGGADEAARLIRGAADSGAAGVVLRHELATSATVGSAAESADVTLVSAGEGIPWAHLVWLLRGVIDRSAPGNDGAAPRAGAHHDLFAIADTVATIVDAPVTIEDNRSRVLAYSSGQQTADTARVATIVGRRVPEEVVERYRARGVFRRLNRSDEPFLIPEGPDGTRPRLVVPVRAGGEWLGSIWAVVSGSGNEVISPDVDAGLRRAASVIALHLLRLRAQADVARRSAADRLRSVLWQYSPERAEGLELAGPAPWRVVALAAPGGGDSEEQLELWQTLARRHGWPGPALADLDGVIFAVAAAGSGPGSWPWLEDLVRGMARLDGRGWSAAAGRPATVAELPRSRSEATEVASLIRVGRIAAPTSAFEEAWDALVVQRAAAAVDPDALGGPATRLRDHDRTHGTSYLATVDAWLRHYGEPARAAAALTIHPNTLRYRMRRLSALIDVDLDEPRQRLALLLLLEAVRPDEGPRVPVIDRSDEGRGPSMELPQREEDG